MNFALKVVLNFRIDASAILLMESVEPILGAISFLRFVGDVQKLINFRRTKHRFSLQIPIENAAIDSLHGQNQALFATFYQTVIAV